jgi:hypothetical protein
VTKDQTFSPQPTGRIQKELLSSDLKKAFYRLCKPLLSAKKGPNFAYFEHTLKGGTHMRITALSIMLSTGLLSACGGAGFLGKSSSSSSSDQSNLIGPNAGDAMDPAVVGPDSVKGGDVVLEPPTEKEKESIANCAKAWGKDPPVSYEKVRKIYASVSVGSSGVTLQDKAQTTGPSLTLLYAGVNVGGTPVWELTNPNGWYCIVVTVNVKTDLTVRLAQTAHLADSKVAVNVGSKTEGEAVSAIGVNVGSEITVERI